jgi:hypothetical protein
VIPWLSPIKNDDLYIGKKKIFFFQLQVRGEEVFVQGLFRKSGLNGNELDSVNMSFVMIIIVRITIS